MKHINTILKSLHLLGILVVLAGVHKFPSRVKCAMLAWHTMINSLETSNEIVSTE